MQSRFYTLAYEAISTSLDTIQLYRHFTAMKPVSRSDFISDASSDDESLPELGSLRERLAKKRKLASESLVVIGNGMPGDTVVPSHHMLNDEKGCCKGTDVSQQLAASGSGAVIDLEVASPTKDEAVSDAVDRNTDTVSVQVNCADTFSDSSVEEVEKLSLSQIIASSHQDLHDDNEVAPSAGGAKGHNSESKVEDSRSEVKVKKKRTAEEIEESRRKAQEKREERERQKQAKEAEKQMRKAERETKRQFSLGSCLKYVKVLVDTHVVNTCGLGTVLFKACEELGISCETRELPLPFTIMWKRRVTECNLSADNKVETLQSEQEEQEVLAVIPVADFILMVNSFKQSQRGNISEDITLRKYVQQIQTCLSEKVITLIVLGLEQYFKDLKSKTNKQYREAVQASSSNPSGKPGKGKPGLVKVTRVDVEEAVTDVLLQTGCSTFMLETPEDVADMVRRFSKAVAERPAKKDRFDPVFSFHEEGVGGVKVDKNGVGLLKVWKQQLLQFKNVSPDVGQAIIAEYPSPMLLRQAYQKCSSEKEAVKLLENIVVRRGAGVLETTRRVGKELSRRIFMFFTSQDPGLVIK